jgi:hypothetical protein
MHRGAPAAASRRAEEKSGCSLAGPWSTTASRPLTERGARHTKPS